jgi:cobalt-zinc-cadmium efflux system outer membrane protein
MFRRYQGDIAKAEANQAYVQQIQPVLRTTVQARLDGSRDALNAMLEALANLDQYGIPAGERAVEASFSMYKSGKTDLLQVLLARRELALAKSRRLDLLESAWRAYADLAALSGDWP